MFTIRFEYYGDVIQFMLDFNAVTGIEISTQASAYKQHYPKDVKFWISE